MLTAFPFQLLDHFKQISVEIETSCEQVILFALEVGVLGPNLDIGRLVDAARERTLHNFQPVLSVSFRYLQLSSTITLCCNYCSLELATGHSLTVVLL